MTRHLPPRVAEGPALARLGLVHRVRRPEGPGPHPTVVMLHGLGGSEDAMWVFAPSLPRDWLVLAPRAPLAEPEGGYAWLHRARDEWPELGRFGDAVAMLLGFLDGLPETYAADSARLYLMGFSQGAATAYATAFRHPGRLRGIAGLVGFVPAGCADRLAGQPLAELPVFAAVGLRDPLIPLDRAEAGLRLLREGGADLTVHADAVGHKLSAEGMRALRGWWGERDLDLASGNRGAGVR